MCVSLVTLDKGTIIHTAYAGGVVVHEEPTHQLPIETGRVLIHKPIIAEQVHIADLHTVSQMPADDVR